MAKNIKFNFKTAAIFSALVGGVILFGFLVFCCFSGIAFWEDGEFDPGVSSNIGEFIGGVVGSFWALSSVLLLFQTLKYQTDELREQRETNKKQNSQFQIERITGVIYQQLAKLDQSISELELNLVDNGDIVNVKGKKALIYLNDVLGETPNLDEDSIKLKNASKWNEDWEFTKKQINDTIKKNESGLFEISMSYYLTVNLIRESLKNSNLGMEEKEELKKIYSINHDLLFKGLEKLRTVISNNKALSRRMSLSVENQVRISKSAAINDFIGDVIRFNKERL